MALPGSDEPASIGSEEARQELFGRGPSKVGMEIYEVIAIMGGIIVTVIGFMIAVSPDRPE